MKNKLNQIDWLNKQIEKDKNELETDKLKFINEIKNTKKENIITTPKKEKLTIWQRLKKVLMG